MTTDAVVCDHAEMYLRIPIQCTKTLGVWWHAVTGVFTFRESVPEEDMPYTKRNF